jgi:hypothetical protein
MTTITKAAELHKMPVGSTVSTGSAYVYTKEQGGRWSNAYSRNAKASWLLDPEHSVQPIRVLVVTS